MLNLCSENWTRMELDTYNTINSNTSYFLMPLHLELISITLLISFLIMESAKQFIKFETFREDCGWEELAKQVCNWVNTNTNVCRLTGISAVHCYYSPVHLINIYYNDIPLSQDALMQSGNYVLTYEHYSSSMSWVNHNKELANKVS